MIYYEINYCINLRCVKSFDKQFLIYTIKKQIITCITIYKDLKIVFYLNVLNDFGFIIHKIIFIFIKFFFSEFRL